MNTLKLVRRLSMAALMVMAITGTAFAADVVDTKDAVFANELSTDYNQKTLIKDAVLENENALYNVYGKYKNSEVAEKLTAATGTLFEDSDKIIKESGVKLTDAQRLVVETAKAYGASDDDKDELVDLVQSIANEKTDNLDLDLLHYSFDDLDTINGDFEHNVLENAEKYVQNKRDMLAKVKRFDSAYALENAEDTVEATLTKNAKTAIDIIKESGVTLSDEEQKKIDAITDEYDKAKSIAVIQLAKDITDSEAPKDSLDKVLKASDLKTDVTKAENSLKIVKDAQDVLQAASDSVDSAVNGLSYGLNTTNTQVNALTSVVEDHENRITDLEGRMDDAEDDIKENAEGIAVVGAMATLPTPYEGKSIMALGGATHAGKVGIAAAVGHNFIIKDGNYSVTLTAKGGFAGKTAVVGASAALNF